jgi:uncharacterized cupredoxin-like copper-binding protein
MEGMMTTMRPRSRLLTLLFALLLVPALLVACAEDEGDGDDAGLDTGDPVATAENGEDGDNGEDENGGGSEIDVEMVDIDYSTEQIEATAAEPLTINFENTGALVHDFTIDEGPFTEISSEGGTDESGGEWAIHYALDPGNSGSLTFTTTEAGEYTFYCTVPGHREAGMEGTLTVE